MRIQNMTSELDKYEASEACDAELKSTLDAMTEENRNNAIAKMREMIDRSDLAKKHNNRFQ